MEIENTAEGLRRGEFVGDEIVRTGQGLPEVIIWNAETPVKSIRPGSNDDYFVDEQLYCGVKQLRDVYLTIRESIIERVNVVLEKRRQLFNFVVPMFPTRWLYDDDRLHEYRRSPQSQRVWDGYFNAVLDRKGPPQIGMMINSPTRWSIGASLTDLLDGAHKLHASSEREMPLTY